MAGGTSFVLHVKGIGKKGWRHVWCRVRGGGCWFPPMKQGGAECAPISLPQSTIDILLMS